MIKIVRQAHVTPPDDNPSITDPRQVITLVQSGGDPRWVIEKWTACKCSDGPCEQGRMTKYKITIEQADFAEMDTLFTNVTQTATPAEEVNSQQQSEAA